MARIARIVAVESRRHVVQAAARENLGPDSETLKTMGNKIERVNFYILPPEIYIIF